MGLAQSRRGEVLRDSDTTTGGSFILDGSFLPSFHPSRDLAQRGAPGCSGVKVCICTRFLNWLQRVCEFAAEGDAAELRGAAKCCSIVAQPVQRNRRCRAHLCEFAAERVKNRSRCSVIDGHIVARPAAGPQ